MKFLPLVFVKRKLLRWSPERSRPEIAKWQIGDEVGGEYCWENGAFQGIKNGRIVFKNYEGLNDISLWRGTNQSLRQREIKPLQAMEKIKIDTYTPGQWVN